VERGSVEHEEKSEWAADLDRRTSRARLATMHHGTDPSLQLRPSGSVILNETAVPVSL
jgi:hypothetical protein